MAEQIKSLKNDLRNSGILVTLSPSVKVDDIRIGIKSWHLVAPSLKEYTIKVSKGGAYFSS